MRRAAVLGALVLVGCGTTNRTASVGSTLRSRTLRATVLEVRDRVPARHDVTGLGTAPDGSRWFGVRMRLCRREHGMAVNSYAFVLEAGGRRLRPQTVETVLPDGFDVSRSGCEAGWLVYAVPEAAAPGTLDFRYDDTGGGINHVDRTEHAHFRWKLG